MTGPRFHELLAKCRDIITALRSRYHVPACDCDDLEQEMALALLEIEEGTDSYCLSRAAWRALDWLRKTHASRVAGEVKTLSRDDIIDLEIVGECRRIWV